MIEPEGFERWVKVDEAMRLTRTRPDRAGGELAAWTQLFASLLGTEPSGIVLRSGLGARLLARACRASAVTLGTSVSFSSAGWREIRRGSDPGLVLLAHELVHVRQYRERGFARFVLAYVGEYLEGRLQGSSHREAYRGISFEREARRGEQLARRLLASQALLRGNWGSSEIPLGG